MGPLQELAAELGADERTLRRAASEGTIHCRRPGPRRLRLAPGERTYLEARWGLLSKLRQALRTERRVRLAVLYGSFARGDEDAGSDVDVLVALSGDDPMAVIQVQTHLKGVTGRPVDIARLGRVEGGAPLLLDRILDEGRVLVDRDDLWRDLLERRRAIRARARRAHRRQMSEAAQAIEELVG
jgi:predicted nucleotidyltransferase